MSKGYDVNYAWGIGVHSHDMGGAMLPEMMRWLWRDQLAVGECRLRYVPPSDGTRSETNRAKDWDLALLPSPGRDRWLVATLGLAVLQIIEMGLHAMAFVDAGALAHGEIHGGLSTPVLTTHIWLSTLAFTPFAVAFLGLIWTGTRERVLGSPWILWLGVIGAVAYGTVMWLAIVLEIEEAGVLFPIAHLAVPLWFVLAGVWPTRRPAGLSGRAGAVGTLKTG
jgi:hypothetical protein